MTPLQTIFLDSKIAARSLEGKGARIEKDGEIGKVRERLPGQKKMKKLRTEGKG